MKLAYDYSPLWKLLTRRNLTKGDLKNMLGCSSSTVAKLSAGQCVSMEMLGSIATQLNCGLDDIVRISPVHSFAPWQNISNNMTFRIRLFFCVNDNVAVYALGYANPYAMTDGSMDQWKIDPSLNHPGAWVVEGNANGGLLLDMLASAERGESLGKFVDGAKITLKAPDVKKALEAMIRSAAICNGRCVYRPPYLLPSWQVCRKIRQASLPELSPTNGLMTCESLVGLEKQILYETNGTPDRAKMRQLLALLESELAVSRGVSDVKRLGNFEVLSYPSGGYDGECAVSISVEDGAGKDGTSQIIRVTFREDGLRGDYLVGLTTFAGTNPISDTIRKVSCDGTPLEITYPTRQIISRLEIKIWKDGAAGGNGGELILYRAHDLSLESTIDLQVLESQFSMDDRWEKLLSRAKKELPPQRVSRLAGLPPATAANAWEADDALGRAFRFLLSDPMEPGMDRFFPEGERHQVEYLEWLRQVLDQPGIQRVVLIDPYVKLDTLNIMLRCLKDVGPVWDIYTDDSNNGGVKRVAEIGAAKASLDLAAPPEFSIYSVSKKLHDRLLILLEQERVTAYMLSNSFDKAAENYSSIAVRLEDHLTRTICDYYLELFARERKGARLKTVYASPQARQETQKESTAEITVILPEGIDPRGEVEATGDGFEILARFLREGAVKLVPYFQFKCLYFAKFFSGHKVVDYALLTDAGYLSEQIVNYHHFTWRSPILGHAARTLLKSDLSAFIDVLGRIAETPSDDGKFNFCPGYLGILMIYTLLESSGGLFRDAEARRALFTSELAPVRAIAAVQCVYAARVFPHWEGIPVQGAADELQERLTPEEFLHASVFFLRELRVHPKAFIPDGNETAAAGNPDTLCCYVVRAIQSREPENRSTDVIQNALVPLYPQFSYDIGRILYEAWEAKAVKKDAAVNLFAAFILMRYQDSYRSGQADLRPDDLERICELLDLAYQIDSDVIRQIQKSMKKIEINLCSRLYQPFLKQQDYNVWKHTIDLFGALVYLELYIQQKYTGRRNSAAVAEYREICKNFETDLRRYSQIYCAVEHLSTE